VLDANAAEDITGYINQDTVPNWDQLLTRLKSARFIREAARSTASGTPLHHGPVYNKKLSPPGARLDP